MDSYFYIYIIIINIAAFVISGFDKNAARKNMWRVPEMTLFLISAAGGSIGMYVSMRVFRHKTKHLRFMIGIPLIFILQLVLLYMVFFT